MNEREFSDAYDSFGIGASSRQAEQMSAAFKVTSIPALSLDGKYLVRILDNGTFEQQLAAVSELIESIRQERLL